MVLCIGVHGSTLSDSTALLAVKLAEADTRESIDTLKKRISAQGFQGNAPYIFTLPYTVTNLFRYAFPFLTFYVESAFYRYVDLDIKVASEWLEQYEAGYNPLGAVVYDGMPHGSTLSDSTALLAVMSSCPCRIRKYLVIPPTIRLFPP